MATTSCPTRRRDDSPNAAWASGAARGSHDREVRRVVDADELRGARRAVGEAELELMRAGDDVRVRQHVAVGGEDDAGPGARWPAPRRAPDADHGGARPARRPARRRANRRRGALRSRRSGTAGASPRVARRWRVPPGPRCERRRPCARPRRARARCSSWIDQLAHARRASRECRGPGPANPSTP